MLVYIFIIFLLFGFFDINFFYVNEEFLIFVCISLVFYFLLVSLRKFVNSFFYFRVEFIYFSFLYLLRLNISLINKIISLIALDDLRLDTSFVNNLYATFFNFITFRKNIVIIFSTLSLKKFILNSLYFLYVLTFLVNSNNLLITTNISDNVETLVQEISASSLVDLVITNKEEYTDLELDLIDIEDAAVDEITADLSTINLIDDQETDNLLNL